MEEALEQFFEAVPMARKIVVLVPREGVSPDQWTCRQALKRDLVAEINKLLECAAA